MPVSLFLFAMATGCGKEPAPIVMDDTTDSETVTDTTPDDTATSGTDDTGNTDTDTTTTTTTTDTTTTDTDTSPPEDTEVEVEICDTFPTLPLSYSDTSGWSGAEDFTFDGDGYHVSVDGTSLVRRNRKGEEIVVRPGVGGAAGIHMMPDGEHIVYANISSNSIQTINLYDGGLETILSGLSYPNGVEVGLDGMIYVAEHSAGRILQIDPKTGASVILAEDMYAPNGIGFGPDHETLYWNSFGDGGIRAVTRDGDGWTEPFLVGAVPQSSTWWEMVGGNPCTAAIPGDTCYVTGGGIGECAISPGSDGSLSCSDIDTEQPCFKLEAGDACSHDLFGVTSDSICVESGGGGPGGVSLSCPVTSAERIAECEDVTPGGACDLDKGKAGTCERNWEGFSVCVDKLAEDSKLEEVCIDASQYDPCIIEGDYEPTIGACNYGGGTLTCGRVSTYGGALDGLNVDECGNVYVTDFVDGGVWVLKADGDGVAEVVASLPSYWIPNLHWGNGVGGWETDVLYVADRGGYGPSGAKLFELDIVVGGAPEAFTPETTDTGEAGR